MHASLISEILWSDLLVWHCLFQDFCKFEPGVAMAQMKAKRFKRVPYSKSYVDKGLIQTLQQGTFIVSNGRVVGVIQVKNFDLNNAHHSAVAHDKSASRVDLKHHALIWTINYLPHAHAFVGKSKVRWKFSTVGRTPRFSAAPVWPRC